MAESAPLALVKHGYLKIRTKSAELVPLKLTFAQNHLYNIIRKIYLSDKPARIIVLKARQLKITTLIQSIIYALTAFKNNVNSLDVADDEKGATFLLEMCKIFHNNIAQDYPHLHTPKHHSNEKKLEFEGRLSQIITETAANTDAGRKYTFQNVHLTEVAFYKNPAPLLTAINQSVPSRPRTLIVMESTANGQGNFFHVEWRRAEQGKSDWVPIFIPWYWEEDYEMEPEQDDQVFHTHLENDEREMKTMIQAEFPGMAVHSIHKKLYWRRWAIHNNCHDKPEIFRQEYPTTAQEAFLGSGRHVFDYNALQEHKKRVSPPKWQGVLRDEDTHIEFMPLDSGLLQVWHQPEVGEHYIIFADVAEGLSDGNFSSIDVFHPFWREQVAHWRGHVPPDELGEFLAILGRYYNNSLVVVECNNHGIAVLMKLKDLRYPKIYKRQRYDRIANVETDLLGWRTDNNSKPTIISYLDEDLRRFNIKINSKETIDELETFVQHEDGSLGAELGEGIFDDRVISIAGSNFISRVTPEMAQKVTEKEGSVHRQSFARRRPGRKTGY